MGAPHGVDAVYTAAELRDDARGYGLIHYVAQGTQIIIRGPAWGVQDTYLIPKYADTFLHSLYALVSTTREIAIYRFHGVDPSAEAQMLGSWWTPQRPALAIDALDYESFHNQSRSDAAIRREWNPMSEVAQAKLRTGSLVFVGRIGPQSDGLRTLAGGSIQFLLPERGHALSLNGNTRVR